MSETMLDVVGGEKMTFDTLVRKVKAGELVPMVCHDCGCIVAGEEYAVPTEVLGERKCPECGSSEMNQATPDNFDGVFEWHYPWRLCEHCDLHFLWDDDVSRLIEPDPDKCEPGTLGCPRCRKLTT
jgi:hypothetical protein